MRLFSRQHQPSSQSPELDTYAMRRRAEEENLAEYDRLAREKEAELLAEAPHILAEMVARHERDVAAYSFECRRFGDFLTVFLERGRIKDWGSEWQVEKFSTGINIGRTKTIRLENGNAPDEKGRVMYRAHLRAKGGGGTSYCWPGPPMPDENYERAVNPDWRFCRRWARNGDFVTIVDREDKGHSQYWEESLARHVTENFPRDASDDHVHFYGADISINAPAGLGGSVLEKVMAAIVADAPKLVDPKLSP